MSETKLPPISKLLSKLQDVLIDLSENSYPDVPNPNGCKKRASVSLIIRVQPHPSAWPNTSSGNATQAGLSSNSDIHKITTFLSQSWVQQGDPEVLFIKRAARSGDRWTGHIALPGGKRDPEDETDRAAAIRETQEEVGLDLSHESCLFIGNLPQRVVTTSWGRVPLMVLCPFVFLMTCHEIPHLKLQPSEVGSAHWVPLRALLLPALRDSKKVDVSERLAKQGGTVARVFLRMMLGSMVFSAVRLLPSESLYCSSAPGFLPQHQGRQLSIWERTSRWCFGQQSTSLSTEMPLLLWGLTLGIIEDFLDLLPPHDVLKLSNYPTYTAPDLRFVIWCMTYAFRKRKQREVEHVHGVGMAALKTGLEADSPGHVEVGAQADDGTIEGLGDGDLSRRIRRNQRGSRLSPTGVLLDGYFDLLRSAIYVTLIARAAVGSGVLGSFLVWYRRRR
ncbi:MAG: hypothetical protein M1837_004621 [Sclerophora amabilis]|nr:MAG: hypothetical protein M1837_004621 [Sclerophora amabilis]